MNIGIIGAGRQGWRRADPVIEHGDKVIWVADISYDAANKLANKLESKAATDWQQLTTDKNIDAVIICTPPDQHEIISISAMENGKHVLCEKPLARNVSEAQKMVDRAKKGKLVLKCGFNLRFHPGIRQAKVLMESGIIGELIFARCRYGIGGRPDYDKDWRMNPKIAGGGQVIDQGIHIIDLSRYFLGDFNEVTGFTGTMFWDSAPVEDNVFALLRNNKGQVASLHASWTQWKNLFSFEIYGKDGYITVEGLGGSYGNERLTLGKRDHLGPFKEDITYFRGEDRSWFNEWKEFVDSISEKREPSGNGYDGLEALKIAECIYKSNNEHRFCSL